VRLLVRAVPTQPPPSCQRPSREGRGPAKKARAVTTPTTIPSPWQPGVAYLQRAASRQVAGVATRWLFYAFMFSLPFDVVVPAWLPEWLQGDLSIPRMIGLVLLIAFLLDPRLRPWRVPPAIGWFAAYFTVFLLRVGIYAPSWAFQQFQLLVFFFICYNLFMTSRIIRGALLSFVASCAACAGLTLLGTLANVEMIRSMGDRVSAFGMNPNLYAKTLIFGAIAALGLAHVRRDKSRLPSLVFWGLAAVLIVGVADTGSRGMSLGLVVGLAALVFRKGSLSVRFRGLLLAAVALLVACWLLSQSEVLVERWTSVWEKGQMGHRPAIALDALKMSQEKPLLGWGPTATAELGERQGMRSVRATHNRPLALMTTLGALGTLPFYCGYVLVVLWAWRARRGVEDVLPFAFFMAMSVSDVVSGGLPAKLDWMIFAYMSASGRLAARARSYGPVRAEAANRPPLRRRNAP